MVGTLSRNRRVRCLAWLLIGVFFVMTTGCAEIEETSHEHAEELAYIRADMEYIAVLVQYQKSRKTEAVQKGEHPDKYDDALALQAEKRFERLWEATRHGLIDKFEHHYQHVSEDTLLECLAMAKKENTRSYEVDRCTDKKPTAKYDPLKTTGVAGGILLLIAFLIILYRSGRRRLDPVAVASKRLGMTVEQGRDSTTLTGSYKGQELRIESSSPETGRGDKYIRVSVLSNVDAGVVVGFGPVAPPTGLELPELKASDMSDNRLPVGYSLRLSEGASAEELLTGDLGFQLREFDPVDVRVHDGMCVITTWFLVADSVQVMEFVELCLSVADVYKAS